MCTSAAGGAARRGRGGAAGGLVCIVIAAGALRLVPVVFVPSLDWGDEVFQTVEPAHRLVYGYGLVPWEFQLGMRSWLLPGAIAGLMELAGAIGNGPGIYLPLIATALGLLGCAPVVCVFLWCRRPFGLPGAFVAAGALAVAPELVYFGARALDEVVAAHLAVVAAYLIDPGRPADSPRRLAGAGALLALACLLRLQLAPAAAVLALWPAGGAWRARVAAIVAGGLAGLAFGAAFDWATLGFPLASVWRNLYDNLYLGVSAGFGVEPWSYYVLGELGVWGAALPLVALLVALGARRMPALLAAAVALVAVHSLVPHKEYRFIYPAVVLLMVPAAIGLAELTSGAVRWLRQRGARQGVAAAGAMAVVWGSWGAVAFAVWSHQPLAGLRRRVHDELAAMSYVRTLPGLCGVGLYGRNAWVRYGGYTYLDRPVPMYWPEDAAAVTAAASAFDAFLSETAPPPALGFAQVRCFGSICVYRRPGGCTARPMQTMPFPPPLRALAPAPEKFEAVPQRLRPGSAG